MGLKTAGVGHFTIPTAPAAGTSCTSGAANAFTTTYVVLSASAPAALFITGIHLESSAALAATYIVVQLAVGGAGSETIIGQYLVPLSTASTVALGYRQIYPPIPVANAARVTCKTADSVGAKATLVTLECINQSNVVDDGIAVGTVSQVTGLTASNLDAAISSRMASYTQPTGFLTATFPAGTVANTTNITAGTITTVTNLTNAPTAGDLTATMKTSVTTAATAATPTAAAVTGNVGGNVTGSVGSVVGLTASNLDATVSSRLATAGYTAPLTAATTRTALGLASANLDTQIAALDSDILTRLASSSYTAPLSAAGVRTAVGLASANLDTQIATLLPTASYTAPDNASITAIKAKTDSLTFTVAGFIDSNCLKVNGVTITGLGTVASPWKAP